MCALTARRLFWFGVAMGLLASSASGVTITWTNGSSDGLWSTPGNWDLGRAPGGAGFETDDVVIPDVSGTTVTYSAAAGSRTINSLTCVEGLTLSGGTLAVTITADMNGALLLSGGTLSGGTWDVTGGSLTAGSNSANSLNGVIVIGDIIMGNSSALRIEGGTTFTNLRMSALGSSGSVGFADGSVITGDILSEVGTLSLGMIAPGGTLTVAPSGSILTGTSGNLNVGIGGFAYTGSMTLVNQGTIGSDVGARTLTINAATSFTNESVARATNGGTLVVSAANWTNGSTGTLSANASTLTFEDNWSNAGSISLTNSTLNLDGTFTTAGLGMSGFTRTGGTVNILSTLNNVSSTLTLNSTTGSWTLLAGAISSGTVQLNDSQTLIASGQSANSLNGVTVNGDIIMGNSSRLRIEGGTTFTNLRMSALGSSGSVGFADGSVITGTIVSEAGTLALGMITPGGTLTVAPSGSILTGTSGNLNVGIGFSPYTGNMTFVNQGTIGSDVSGRTLTINAATSFTNESVARATNGGTLVVSAATWTNTNSGTLSADASTLTFEDSWSNAGSISLTNSTLNLDGTFSTATLNTAGFSRTGGAVNILGSLDNTSSTLTLANNTGSWNINGGSISGGTVQLNDGQTLTAGTSTASSLSNLTVNGDVVLSATNARLKVEGAFSTITLRLSGSGSAVGFAPGHLFRGQLWMEGAATGNRTVAMNGTAGALNIDQTGSIILASGTGASSAIIGQRAGVFGGNMTLNNRGKIWNRAGGRTLVINATTFGMERTLRSGEGGTRVTEAVLETDAGATIDATASAFTNFAANTLTGGIYDLAGTFKFADANIVTNEANIILDGAGSSIVNQSDADALANYAATTSQGALELRNGGTMSTSVPVTNNGTITLGPSGVMTITGDYVQSSGTVVLDGGTLDPTGMADIQGGLLTGSGTVDGNLANSATIHVVDNSTDSINVMGDFTQGSSGLMQIGIGGCPGRGCSPPVMTSGAGALDGTLTIGLVNGFEPAVGTSFDLLSASAVNGTFATTNLPLVFGGSCKAGPEYEPTTVSVTTYAVTVFTDHPDSQTICQPNPVTFTVATDGSGPFSYQWRKDGEDISGANSSSYTIASVAPGDAGDYDCVASNFCGPEFSNPATLTVQTPPVISNHPDSQTACPGDSATLCVTASGTPAPAYQWFKDGAEISGATQSCYMIPSVVAADAGSYDVDVTNACGTETSNPAVLALNADPSISDQPDSQSVCSGSSATFSVTASGVPAPSYQWRKDGNDISGATSPSFTIDPASPSDTAAYDCVVTNACSSIVSDPATLTVGAPAASVTAAFSRKANPAGPGGNCDLSLLPGIESEPHQGGVTQVRISFDVPPGGPGANPVSVEQGTCAAPAFVPYAGLSVPSASLAGNELVVNFAPSLENARTYRITVNSSVTCVAGQRVYVRGLVADATGDGLVNAADRSAIVGIWTGPGFSCATDINSSGQTNAADRSAVVGAWTSPQNCAP